MGLRSFVFLRTARSDWLDRIANVNIRNAQSEVQSAKARSSDAEMTAMARAGYRAAKRFKPPATSIDIHRAMTR